MQGFLILFLAFHIMYSYAATVVTKNLKHGENLNITLLHGAVRLEFDASAKHRVNKLKKDVLWDTSSTVKRGIITEKDSKRIFIIYHATFDDDGLYTQLNGTGHKKKMNVTISKIIYTQHCVAGENFNIPLAGLKKDNATLLFYKTKGNYSTLVKHGSPVENLHYMGRIQVADDSIRVLNVGVSDMGHYIITDCQKRFVVYITMKLDGKKVNPLYALLLLLGIPFCGCCCKKLCKDDTSQLTTTTDVKYDAETSQLTAPAGPAPGYTPAYPAEGASTVYPPLNPAFPHQPPYCGYPATANLTCYAPQLSQPLQ